MTSWTTSALTLKDLLSSYLNLKTSIQSGFMERLYMLLLFSLSSYYIIFRERLKSNSSAVPATVSSCWWRWRGSGSSRARRSSSLARWSTSAGSAGGCNAPSRHTDTGSTGRPADRREGEGQGWESEYTGGDKTTATTETLQSDGAEGFILLLSGELIQTLW